MMLTEITEEEEEEEEENWFSVVRNEEQKEKIRRIIRYQKSLHLSSPTHSSPSSSSSLYSLPASCSSRKSSVLLDLMKNGSTSLRRLFDMEHTSLANHFQDYSGSPVVKPILLWGSDTDDEAPDPWASFKPIDDTRSDEQSVVFGLDVSSMKGEVGYKVEYKVGEKKVIKSHTLTRKKSFRRLPGFGSWRRRKFRLKLRLRRLRIMICGRLL